MISLRNNKYLNADISIGIGRYDFSKLDCFFEASTKLTIDISNYVCRGTAFLNSTHSLYLLVSI